MLLKISNLDVYLPASKKILLKQINLELKQGEVIYILGPNGAGKSALLNTIAGSPFFKVKTGKILFNNKDITNLSPDKRARLGIFLSWQQAPEISSITWQQYFSAIWQFLPEPRKKHALQQQQNMQALLNMLIKQAGLPNNILKKPVNVDMSGGEKKKMQLIELLFLQPQLLLLDELDSGLDINSTHFVFDKIKTYLKENLQASAIIVTHTFKVKKVLPPNKVFILKEKELLGPFSKQIIDKIQKTGFK